MSSLCVGSFCVGEIVWVVWSCQRFFIFDKMERETMFTKNYVSLAFFSIPLVNRKYLRVIMHFFLFKLFQTIIYLLLMK